MFVRTERLLLRPGWVDDAPALARAIGEEAIVRNLATAPWPYDVGKARAFLAQDRDPRLPSLLIFARTHGAPRLVGGCGLNRVRGGEDIEIGYWISRLHWGLGYATEAGRALVELADVLGIRALSAGHFVDNPASGRVLRKLGFRPTGRAIPRESQGRGEEALCALYVRDAEDCSMPCPTPPVPLAA